MPHHCLINSAVWIERSGLGGEWVYSVYPLPAPLSPHHVYSYHCRDCHHRQPCQVFQQVRSHPFGSLRDFSCHLLSLPTTSYGSEGPLKFNDLLLKGASWDRPPPPAKANSNLHGETCHFFTPSLFYFSSLSTWSTEFLIIPVWWTGKLKKLFSSVLREVAPFPATFTSRGRAFAWMGDVDAKRLCARCSGGRTEQVCFGVT